MTRSDALDLFGVTALAAFAACIWPPACLLVFGAAALVMAWVDAA